MRVIILYAASAAALLAAPNAGSAQTKLGLVK
jgi:hypothetical protein